MYYFYYIATFGCQMNVHDSEKLAGILENIGYTAAKSIETADIIVFNTCCIRDTAEKKIEGNIGELKRLKRLRPHLIIAVTGCMSQQEGKKEDLHKKFPFIDIILGTNNAFQLGGAISEMISGRRFSADIDLCANPPIDETVPVFRTSGTNAWVNIMFGCNNFCTYCIVPHVRGRERSRGQGEILDEINRLLDSGYKEITLLGQNVNSYGNDSGGTYGFETLLGEISKIDGKFRVRFMTSHPKDFTSGIADIIRDSKNICKNVHLPVQSGSNRILKLMNRRYTAERYNEILDYLKAIPGIGITTDIMVGFPTETEEDFSDTLELVKKAKFSTAFTFVYSPRKGTPAAAMEQLSPQIKKERITRLVDLQNEITKELSRDYIGKTYEVLAEDANPKYENILCGRTDSGRLVNFPGDLSLIGNFLDIKIQKAKSAALWGAIDG